MNRGIFAGIAALAVASSVSATFSEYYVTSSNVTSGSIALTVYTLWARFNGPTDTVLNAYNFAAVGSSSLTGFWHKDNAYYNTGVLSQEFGTWNPSQTGSITLNRPFDSYLTIGGLATPTNTTNADPSWVSGGSGTGAGDSRSWNRADIPNNGTSGWFNSNPPNNAGRVGINNNPADSVRLGQFVLSQSDTAFRTYSLTIGYNSGIAGSPVQFGNGQFSLPTPGAIALLGLAGLAGRRRR